MNDSSVFRSNLEVFVDLLQLPCLLHEAGGQHVGEVDPLADFNSETIRVVLESGPGLVKLRRELLSLALVCRHTDSVEGERACETIFQSPYT